MKLRLLGFLLVALVSSTCLAVTLTDQKTEKKTEISSFIQSDEYNVEMKYEALLFVPQIKEVLITAPFAKYFYVFEKDVTKAPDLRERLRYYNKNYNSFGFCSCPFPFSNLPRQVPC